MKIKKRYDDWFQVEYTYEPIPCETHGKQLFFEKITCENSDPSKNVLVVHGLTCNSSIFDIAYKDYSINRFLCKEGYTVWMIDISGHGRSERWENPLEINTLVAAEDLIAAMEIIKEKAGTKTSLIGWSWGTMTTSKAAGMRPDLVDKLILCSPVTGGTFPSKSKDEFTDANIDVPYAMAARIFPIKGVTGGVEPDEDDFEFDTDRVDIRLVDHVMHMLYRDVLGAGKPNGPSIDIYCNADEWKINPDVIKAPTLILWGDDDIYPSPARIEIMLTKLPEGSRQRRFPGAGHDFMFEKDQYRICNGEILKFLGE